MTEFPNAITAHSNKEWSSNVDVEDGSGYKSKNYVRQDSYTTAIGFLMAIDLQQGVLSSDQLAKLRKFLDGDME